MGDSKAEGEEEWGGADDEGDFWYKRHFRESKEKVFEILGRETLLVDDWKCGGFLASLRALHPKREEKEEESDILRREEEVFSKE